MRSVSSSTKKLWTLDLKFHPVAPPFWQRVWIATGDALPIIRASITCGLSWSTLHMKRTCVLLRHGGLQMSNIVYISITCPEALPPILLILPNETSSKVAAFDTSPQKSCLIRPSTVRMTLPLVLAQPMVRSHCYYPEQEPPQMVQIAR